MSDAMGNAPEPGGQQPNDPAVPPYQGPAQPAYGFPPAAPQPGYGYPPQGGYGYPPLPSADEPDWYALAEQNENAGRRRKRMLVIAGSVLAAAAVAGIVVLTLLLSSNKDKDGSAAADGASASPTAGDSYPPPTTPLEVLSNVHSDKAPIYLSLLYPNSSLTVQGRPYTRVSTDSGSDCTKGVINGLGATLDSLNCYAVYRATYLSDTGVEVTVGIVTFGTESRATKAKAGTKGSVEPLVEDKATPFCQNNIHCATTSNSLGRYAYFTIAGPADGSPVADKDKTALQAAKDIASSVYDTLLERGRRGLADSKG